MGLRVGLQPEGMGAAREGAEEATPSDRGPVLTVIDGSVVLVRVGRICSAPIAIEVLRLCRAALVSRDEVIVDLRQVSEISVTASALLTRGVRNFRGRVRLVHGDMLRERLPVLGRSLD